MLSETRIQDDPYLNFYLTEQIKSVKHLATLEEKIAPQMNQVEELKHELKELKLSISHLNEQQKIFEEKLRYQNLRKELLDRQENSIDTWLSFVGIVITVFGLIAPVGVWFLNRRFNNQITEVNEHINEIKALKQEAKQHADYISKLRVLTTEQVATKSEIASGITSDIYETGGEISQMLKQAFAYEKDNNHEAAISLWKEILHVAKHLKNNKLNSIAYFSLGNQYQKIKRHEEAIENYKHALSFDPSLGQAHNNLGISYSETGQHEMAIASFKEVLKIGQGGSDTHNNLGAAYQKINQYDKAVECYTRAIEINPEFAVAYRGLGAVYLSLEQPEKAIEHLKKAIKLSPDDSTAYNNLAAAYLGMNDYQKAVESFKHALLLAPENSSIHFNLGMTYGKLSQHDKAIECFERAIKLNPEDSQAYYYLGIANACDKGEIKQGRLG